MLRPTATTQTRKRFTTSRVAALAGAGLIEVTLIGTLLSSLGVRIVREIPRTLSVVDIVQPEPPKVELLPVPEPELVQPAMPTVALPDIRIRRPDPAHAITTVAVPKPLVSPLVTAAKPAALIPETPVKSVVATHTTPPYPEISRRLGESGSVQLHINVDANGGVTDVSVARSSGHVRLDQAALDWVKTHWRYDAATRNGAGTPSETDALVVFDLRTAR